MALTVSEDDLPLQCVYRWERKRGQRVFLTQPDRGGKVRNWTWAQAMAEIRRMAAHLQAQNWDRGTPVAILSKNCAWWIMADLAIWMAGHVTVPIYPSLKPVSVRRILEHSQSRACFYGGTDDPDVASLGIPPGVDRISLPTAAEQATVSWERVMRAMAPLDGSRTRCSEDLATIIYTSGTTGQPKGVMHSFGAIAADAVALRELVHATADDRFISYLPLAHIVERCGLECTAILLGTRIFFVHSIDSFLNDLKRARATIFLSVPRLLVKLQQGVYGRIPKEKLDKRLRIPLVRYIVKKRILAALGLGTVRLAASGAAALPADILDWYRRLGLPLVEGYGMTETTITHLPPRESVFAGYVGRALNGVETKISPEGELLIRSPMNMLGYFHDAEATREAFDADGFFHTGDLVAMDCEDQIRIVGRIKDQFKTSKGKYVSPAPIESRLGHHPAIESCCLMGAGMPSPFALVLLTPETSVRIQDRETRKRLEESLERQLGEINKELDPHERLAFLVVVEGPWTIENGLMTPTLKLRRSGLEGRYLGSIDIWRAMNRTVVWESVRAEGSLAS